jgi:hypothetical protein
MQLKVTSDKGSGRPLVFLYEHPESLNSQQAVASLVYACTAMSEKGFRAICLESSKISLDDGFTLAESFEKSLLEIVNSRNILFFGYDVTASLLLFFALSFPKLTRSLILTNAVTRPEETQMSRIIDSLEKFLPLGLPLRSSHNYDVKPYLQRVRCPTLVLCSEAKETYIYKQSQVLSERLPICWHEKVNFSDDQATLNAIYQFLQVPVKCPQKGITAKPLETA